MNRDLLIGILVALVLHGGIALGGKFFKAEPPRAPAADETPVVELAPLPPSEPETLDYVEASGEGGGDLSDLVPPMQADTPAPTASSFVQRIQPPPPPGIARSSDALIIPVRPGIGVTGSGGGNGLGKLFDLASLDQNPVPRVQARTNYPIEMERAGISGAVKVGFIVDAEGNVQNPYVVSSTHREFEAEALRAIARWKFKPGRKNGVEVATRNVQVTFNFNPKDN